MLHAETADMRTVERLIVLADERLWAIVTRAALGYALVPAWAALTGRQLSEWTLIPFFVGVQVALRVVPAVLRKVLPFGSAARAIWTERRQLAKRYDSYQWQKLLFVGLGLAIYALQTTAPSNAQIALASFCLLGGASGLVIWRQNDPRRVQDVKL